jgi:hypothetical protein
MGFEPLEDTLPLPQIVRTMKSITVPSHGRSCTVDYNRSSSNVDGSGQPGSETWRQEESTGSAEQCEEICERSRRDRVWDEVEYLLSSLERTKAMLINGTDWDPDEVKWINERYRLCKRQALDYVLCLNISTILNTVSFPGEHLSYLAVAKRVITDCTDWELTSAIREIGLNPSERVYYKASSDAVSLQEAEEALLRLLGDTEFVVANEFLVELGIPAKSASYTHIKKELIRRGWKWKNKKVQKKDTKVICR